MSASVCNYISTIMEERQRALQGLHVEEGVGGAANSGSGVKRCLFGKPDSMEIQRKYEEIHKEEMKRQEKKWGFNFETETPTDNSRYQWERVGGPVGSDVPASWVTPQLGSSANSDAVNPPVEVDPKETPKPSVSPPPQEPSSSKDNGPTKQSLITDFMPQKRHAPVQSDSSSKRQKMPPSPPPAVSSPSPATAAGGSGAPEAT